MTNSLTRQRYIPTQHYRVEIGQWASGCRSDIPISESRFDSNEKPYHVDSVTVHFALHCWEPPKSLQVATLADT